MKIPAELKELSQIFKAYKKELYIVGGYVRDSYLGISSVLRDDIDLCSSVTPKELKKMLAGTKFEVRNLNESVGVMAIFGKRRYEHATFRREYYEKESHNPDRIEFIKSLEEDSLRRDFKINAIYFNIETGEYVDPLGGLDDVRERRITTTRSPKNVFNDDPERILRLVRFASALGLEIPEDEMFYAKQNAYKIRFISKYRLRNEFEKLLTADGIYPELAYTKTAHVRAMMILGDLDAWKYILPAVDAIKNSKIVDKKGEPIYQHIMNCLKESSPAIRLAVLLHDCGKVKTMELRNNFFGAREFLENIVRKNLGVEGLGYNKEVVERVIKIIKGYDFNKLCLASKNAIKKFIFENHEVVENIVELKTVIKCESRGFSVKSHSAEILRKTYDDMIKKGTPFNRLDLAIRGDDIIKINPHVRIENIDTLIDNLLLKVAIDPTKNNKEALSVLVSKMISSNPDLYLDE